MTDWLLQDFCGLVSSTATILLKIPELMPPTQSELLHKVIWDALVAAVAARTPLARPADWKPETDGEWLTGKLTPQIAHAGAVQHGMRPGWLLSHGTRKHLRALVYVAWWQGIQLPPASEYTTFVSGTSMVVRDQRARGLRRVPV